MIDNIILYYFARKLNNKYSSYATTNNSVKNNIKKPGSELSPNPKDSNDGKINLKFYSEVNNNLNYRVFTTNLRDNNYEKRRN